MNTEFTFLGHNCFLIHNDREALLIDPWLSNTGAFFGSWHQWPPNSHLLDKVKQRCQGKTLRIFLTHEHQDHFDAATLRALAGHPDCTVFIPAFRDKFLRDALGQMHLHTVELSEDDRVGTAIRFRIFIDDSGINHDASIFVATPDFTFFNQNDYKGFDRLPVLKKELGKIDYYAVQFSGANWHPSCFALPEDQRRQLSKKKVLGKFRNVLGGIRTFAPRFFLPAAGPAFFPFLDPALSTGEGTIFVHQGDLDRYLVQNKVGNILYPRPGERIGAESNRVPIPAPTPAEFAQYRDARENAWDAAVDTFSADQFAQVLQRRLDLMAHIVMPPDTPSIAFGWGEGEADWLQVDLVGKILTRSSELRPPYIVLRADTKYFSLMCGSARWQDIALSLRASIERMPDAYSTLANIFLFADESNLVESLVHSLSLSKERIVIEHLGERYEINRYCPHQGGDLAHATVDEDMNVVCPRHSWRFDLKCEGQCKTSGVSIDAVKLGPAS